MKSILVELRLSIGPSDNFVSKSITAILLHLLKNLNTYIISFNNVLNFFDVLLTVHLSIFISVINQLDAQNFCFTISLFHASTCFIYLSN